MARLQHRIEKLDEAVYHRRQDLGPFRLLELAGPDLEPPLTADSSAWPEVSPGDIWGHWETSFLLRGEVDWPDWGQALYLPLGDAGDFSHPEALLYIDERPVAGVDRHHQEVALALSPGPHRLALHGWTGRGGFPQAEPWRRLVLRRCSVVAIDQRLRDFLAVARCALGTAGCLRQGQERAGLLQVLESALGRGKNYQAETLRDRLAAVGPPLDVTLWAAGHAHLDLAWLWTYQQSRGKAARTFHTVTRLLRQFPEFHFTQSQAALYDWVRQDHPQLFGELQRLAREGRWEPTGGMWVEPDVNLAGAESLVRQIMLGARFFERHFPALATPILWLPDTFGFPATLPQLMKGAGLEYFFTSKLGWNDTNRFPYDSFWWEGLDGSRVLASLSTTPCDADGAASTYNAQAEPAEVLGSWERLRDQEKQRDLLLAFGHGDGGGGPTREMLENLREMKAAPYLPRVRQGSALEYFRALEHHSGERLPCWRGELYLERHRGTYTSQARTKQANRKLEQALHDAETLACLAGQTVVLDSAWERLCLNQFHDVLPGSSIGQVYLDAHRLYEEARQEIGNAVEPLWESLSQRLGGDLLLVNTTSFARRGPVWLSEVAGYPRDLPGQVGERGLWVESDLRPYSVTALALGPAPLKAPPDTGLRAGVGWLENRYLRVELDSSGDLARVYDKESRREALAGASEWQAFEDRPAEWDAWELDPPDPDGVCLSHPADRIRLLEAGPLVATLQVERRLLSSRYRQKVRLYHNSRRIDFETWIDWRERHVLLKAAFPLAVRADYATYQIQWGSVRRSTRRDLSWERARFEVCAHHWADLSEDDYGVSLLSDCKYGYDACGNVLRLSLLRAPTWPDPQADQGEHHFTYSLLPHPGRWNEETVSQGYALNYPVLSRLSSGGPAQEALSVVWTDQAWAVIETVKPAEDGRGIIVRLYESQERGGRVVLSAGFPLANAWRCNLLEADQEKLVPVGRCLELDLRPFEIVTVRLI